jgi:hypothetical protein
MPEVAGIRCRRLHVCYKVPLEIFPLTQIAAEFGAVQHYLTYSQSIKTVKERLL